MSYHNWMKRASGLIPPRAEMALACKFRFGVTDSNSTCCEEQAFSTCNYCFDGNGPAQWKVAISDAPVVQVGNVTIDINGTHYLSGSGCQWNTVLPYCGDASCVALVPLRLTLTSDYKIIVQYGQAISTISNWCNYSYEWNVQFSGEDLINGKVDCLAVSGLELTEVSYSGIPSGAKCHITAHPFATDPYDPCECHDKVLYCPFGYLGACMTPGPPYIEMVIDGQSYTLTRTWAYPCEDSPPGCNYGFDPEWVFEEIGEEIPWWVSCEGMQRGIASTGLRLTVGYFGSSYYVWADYVCWRDANKDSITTTIYRVQIDLSPQGPPPPNVLPVPCEGICNLDLEGTLTTESGYGDECRGKGAPRWSNVPLAIRAVA